MRKINCDVVVEAREREKGREREQSVEEGKFSNVTTDTCQNLTGICLTVLLLSLHTNTHPPTHTLTHTYIENARGHTHMRQLLIIKNCNCY